MPRSCRGRWPPLSTGPYGRQRPARRSAASDAGARWPREARRCRRSTSRVGGIPAPRPRWRELHRAARRSSTTTPRPWPWRGLGGRGRRAPDYLAMVVSTGIGGGIVLDGRLLDGRLGNAGHIGHVIVEPDGRRCALRGAGLPRGGGFRHRHRARSPGRAPARPAPRSSRGPGAWSAGPSPRWPTCSTFRWRSSPARWPSGSASPSSRPPQAEVVRRAWLRVLPGHPGRARRPGRGRAAGRRRRRRVAAGGATSRSGGPVSANHPQLVGHRPAAGAWRCSVTPSSGRWPCAPCRGWLGRSGGGTRPACRCRPTSTGGSGWSPPTAATGPGTDPQDVVDYLRWCRGPKTAGR